MAQRPSVTCRVCGAAAAFHPAPQRRALVRVGSRSNVTAGFLLKILRSLLREQNRKPDNLRIYLDLYIQINEIPYLGARRAIITPVSSAEFRRSLVSKSNRA